VLPDIIQSNNPTRKGNKHMKQHNLDTTGWNEFPFSVNSIKFISKIAPNSPFMKSIAKLPQGAFEAMNVSAVKELLSPSKDIYAELYRVNEGATHAVIEVVA
jgi:hypothetical protein